MEKKERKQIGINPRVDLYDWILASVANHDTAATRLATAGFVLFEVADQDTRETILALARLIDDKRIAWDEVIEYGAGDARAQREFLERWVSLTEPTPERTRIGRALRPTLTKLERSVMASFDLALEKTEESLGEKPKRGQRPKEA